MVPVWYAGSASRASSRGRQPRAWSPASSTRPRPSVRPALRPPTILRAEEAASAAEEGAGEEEAGEGRDDALAGGSASRRLLSAAALWRRRRVLPRRLPKRPASAALLKEAVAAAEKKDLDALRAFFAPDYADFEGRDTEGTLRLVTDHLDRYRGVVIHLLGARLEALEPDGRASVTCEVSLSHGAAEVLRKLIRYAGEYYRFEIDLAKAGSREWRFVYAEWRSIGAARALPGIPRRPEETFPRTLTYPLEGRPFGRGRPLQASAIIKDRQGGRT